MKCVILIFCTILTVKATSQVTLFYKLCAESLIAKDSLSEIESNYQSYTLVPTSSSIQELTLVFTSQIAKIGSVRKINIKKSAVLSQLAEFATLSWRGSNYSDKKSWNRLDKKFRRAKRSTISNFTLIKCVSFRINLTEQKQSKVYYDKEGPSGEYNLYYGKKLTQKEIDKGETLVPVQIIDLKGLQKKLIKQLKKNGIYNELRRGTYSSIGVSIMIDEKTVGKNTFPTARVVLFFGAKRLQRIKIKG